MPGSKNQRCYHTGGSPHAASIITHKHDKTFEHLRPWQCCHTISKRHRTQKTKSNKPHQSKSHENQIPTSIPAWSDWILLLISRPCNTSHCSIVSCGSLGLFAPLCCVHLSIPCLHFIPAPTNAGMRKHYTELTLLSNNLACVKNWLLFCVIECSFAFRYCSWKNLI